MVGFRSRPANYPEDGWRALAARWIGTRLGNCPLLPHFVLYTLNPVFERHPPLPNIITIDLNATISDSRLTVRSKLLRAIHIDWRTSRRYSTPARGS
jgi:hypothetical protein